MRRCVSPLRTSCAAFAIAALSSMLALPAPAQTAEGFLVVDCLLPPQIRRLGNSTFPRPRRPIKTTATDCAIRGGEYVAYDRADYATALRVWLPEAEAGDPEARANVGEIYEKGLGVAPDYAMAADWYRLAAAAGNTRAQINLGHLYEKGLGVERDPLEALEWYRRASGLQNAIQLSPAESPGAANLEVLRGEIEQLRISSEALRDELRSARDELDTLREVERERLETEQAPREDGPEQALNETLGALGRQVEQRSAEIVELSRQLEAMRAELTGARDELERNRGELQQQLDRLGATTAELSDTEEEAAARRRELLALTATLEERAAALRERETALDERQDLLQRLQTEVTALETRAEQRRDEIDVLEAQRTVLLERVLAGPEIAMIEPPLPTTRSIVAVPVSTVSGANREIVGRVTAVAGLASLSVNGQRVDANELGVFATNVPFSAGDSQVSIVAVDRQGKRASLDFRLQSTPPEGNRPAAEQEARVELPDVNFGNYYALVIGNNDYTDLSPLRTAVNDAREVAAVLETRYGFTTRPLLNATRYEILSALNDLRGRLTSDDNLLIYYAGHGELDQANARGNWLPVDAERDSTANWISNIAITDILNLMQARQVLVVVDSCYAGSLTRSSVARLEVGLTDEERVHWLRTMAGKRARMVLTSGGLAPVLDAGGGNHSVFAKALLDVLGSNRDLLDGQQLYQAIAARVSYAAANVRFDQVPEYAPIRYAGHEAGDFFFVPKL